MSRCSRYVGRVGALAFALGVGSVIAASPIAFADNTGSAGSSVDVSSGSSKGVSRAVGARRDGNSAAASSGAGAVARKDRRGGQVPVGVPRPVVASRSASLVPLVGVASVSANGAGPVADPVMWTALAAARRELGVKYQLVSAPAAGGVRAVAAGGWYPGAILRVFFGNGTADNPNGGLLIGSGYSWTAVTCSGFDPCNGGNGGVIGSGGDGYNGGDGGSAGWFGWGGAGGAGVPGGNGGRGGRGGLLFGSGGNGGAGGDGGADGESTLLAGNGGAGGDTGLLSLWGRGGNGGDGGAGGEAGVGYYVVGGAGGPGGSAGFLAALGRGGAGGNGGIGLSGGVGGSGGRGALWVGSGGAGGDGGAAAERCARFLL